MASGHEANSGPRNTETLRTRYNLALLLSMEDSTKDEATQMFREVKALSQPHHPWWEHVCQEEEEELVAQSQSDA
eukprot:COSAG03_NODE_343_length_8814_cov_8.113253_7_plen_75_part_00